MIADALPLLGVVAVICLASAAWRRRSGHARPTHDRLDGTDRADLDGLGAPRGAAFLLLFTAPGCATCVPARRVLDEIGDQTATPVIAVDVTDHEHVARAHHVMRAPTTFVVAADGRVAARVSGVPRSAEIVTFLAADHAGQGAPAENAAA